MRDVSGYERYVGGYLPQNLKSDAEVMISPRSNNLVLHSFRSPQMSEIESVGTAGQANGGLFSPREAANTFDLSGMQHHQ